MPKFRATTSRLASTESIRWLSIVMGALRKYAGVGRVQLSAWKVLVVIARETAICGLP